MTEGHVFMGLQKPMLDPLEVVGEFYLQNFIIALFEQKIFGRLVGEGTELCGQEQVIAEPMAGFQEEESSGTV